MLDKDSKRTPHVVIVGAGIGGIITAINLKSQLGWHDFTIYETAKGPGGTWRDNTYPGCGSDVPVHWYSLSTELKPDWPTYYADQPDILSYWRSLFEKHELDRHTVFGASVTAAVWNNFLNRYLVTIRNEDTSQETELEADVLIYAIGGLIQPFWPKDLVGKETFKGDLFHSARWRHDVELKGKKVGVIGNGCSAAQFVPKISEDSSVKLTQFCRTAQWYIPRDNFTYPTFLRWIFTNVPGVLRLYRSCVMLRSDLPFLAFRRNKILTYLMTQRLTQYITSKVPKESVDKLIPNYAPGCRRIIVDPDYLECLHRPNVELEWGAIDKIVEDGIKLKTGETVKLDVIILGTGYTTERTDLRVLGRKGQTMHEYFDSQGGEVAYHGTCFPGFPNLFTLLGPNVSTGHASVIFNEEVQVDYIMELIRPVLEGRMKAVEVSNEATDAYNEWLQRRLKGSVWTDCHSFYHNGRSSEGKLTAPFPGPVSLFWWVLRRPGWEAFGVQGGQGRGGAVVIYTLLVAVAVVAAGYVMG